MAVLGLLGYFGGKSSKSFVNMSEISHFQIKGIHFSKFSAPSAPKSGSLINFTQLPLGQSLPLV